MIRPEEIQDATSNYPLCMDVLERAFDRAIRSAADRRQWPALVDVPRMVLNEQALADTIEKYQSAGWLVRRGTHDGVIEIHRPSAPLPSTGRRHTWITPSELGYRNLGVGLTCRDCGVVQSARNRDADSCPGGVAVTPREAP